MALCGPFRRRARSELLLQSPSRTLLYCPRYIPAVCNRAISTFVTPLRSFTRPKQLALNARKCQPYSLLNVLGAYQIKLSCTPRGRGDNLLHPQSDDESMDCHVRSQLQCTEGTICSTKSMPQLWDCYKSLGEQLVARLQPFLKNNEH